MARFHLEHLCVLHVREHLSNLFLSFVRLSMVFAQDRRAPAPGRHIAHAKEKQKAGDGTVPSSQRNDDGGPPEIVISLCLFQDTSQRDERTLAPADRKRGNPEYACSHVIHGLGPRVRARKRPGAHCQQRAPLRDLPCLTSSVASRARPSVLRWPRLSLMLLLLQTPGLTAP